jgi:hypothetical protein
MNFTDWINNFRKQATQDKGAFALTADLRWISEYALTEGFTQMVRLNAQYELFERDTVDLKDKGLANIIIHQKENAVWQGKSVQKVRIQIVYSAGTLKFANQSEEEVYLYFESLSEKIIGLESPDVSISIQTDKEPLNKWIVNEAQQIGIATTIDQESGEPEHYGLCAYAEPFDNQHYAFRIDLTDPDNLEKKFYKTSWITTADGSPYFHFFQYAKVVAGSDVLLMLMIKF